MPASEQVRNMFGSKLSKSEKDIEEKLIELGVMQTTRHASLEEINRIETNIVNHGGDRNWAVKERVKNIGE